MPTGPTSGTIKVHGDETVFHAPSAATSAGIEMVYQDLALVDAQDIATNLNIGREILRKGPLGWLGFVDHKAQRRGPRPSSTSSASGRPR